MIFEPHQDLPQLDHVDVCVVGGGPAGISLAVELAASDLTVVLLEDGGSEPGTGQRPVYEVRPGRRVTLGVNPGLEFRLGGNSNHWYGNCRPLEEIDFEERPWISDSGWPLTLAELRPFYERACELSGLAPYRTFDLDIVAPSLAQHSSPLLSSVLSTRIVQTTPRFSFATMHRDTLEQSTNVMAFLACHVTSLRTRASDGRVIQADAERAGGPSVTVVADRFVLAAGGVENSRLLQDLNAEAATDLPALDHAGRHFQEHWYYSFPTEFTGARRSDRPSLALYDAGGGDRHRQFAEHRQFVDGGYVWAQLALAPDIVRAKQLPGLALWFTRSLVAPPAIDALKDAIRRRRGRLTAVLGLARRPMLNAEFVWRRLFRRDAPARRLTLIAQVEHTPDPDSKILPGPSTDRWNRSEPVLETELTEELRRKHAQALQIAADEVGLDGESLAQEMEERYQTGRFGYFWHHVGTTRMSRDPSQGVVDPDCLVHGTDNLYIAGSSVFPTSGTAGPTLTIVALAARLAQHLKQTAPR